MKWTDDFLDSKRLITDPLADAVVERMVAEKGDQESRNIFGLLIRNINTPIDQLPSYVQDYILQTNRLPTWTDQLKVKMAQEFFIDHGPKFMLFLYYKSLPLLYVCKNGAQVLYRTGRLMHDPQSMQAFTRRIGQTAQFLLDVMTPGELGPGGQGIRSIQKVRLIHASIRHFVAAKDWSVELLGKPINQEDMAITLMSFSVAMSSALNQFGLYEPPERHEAFLHTWNAIGTVLGIDQDLLPDSVQEGNDLLQKILSRQAGFSEQGKMLTQGLVKFAEESLPGALLDDTPEALIRYLVGNDLAIKLGILQPKGCLAFAFPVFLQRIFNRVENLERKSPRWQNKIDQLSIHLISGMKTYFDHYTGMQFRIPKDMQEHWSGFKPPVS
jgi:hypothetical protein